MADIVRDALDEWICEKQQTYRTDDPIGIYAVVRLSPFHHDHGLVLRLAEIISSHGQLSPAQRTGILNILSGSNDHDNGNFPTGRDGKGMCQDFSYGTPGGKCYTDRHYMCLECSEMNPEMFDRENGCWRQADDPR